MRISHCPAFLRLIRPEFCTMRSKLCGPQQHAGYLKAWVSLNLK
ncbi:hypothetical protein EIKCOROL_02497 [Eikenella corrodens ATCC 23834]|uniref:Uncharacterized protein n=1 Tax=Eikenella corrodens ATCC 23834 TaxID=546274 RepID=C0DYN1_EIKCO|nr:hypothetical protein EIKCOROL_02497 [Eikenella corrodens ATCC 23834]